MKEEMIPLPELLDELNLIEDIARRASIMSVQANVCPDIDGWVNLIAAAHSVTPLDLEEFATCHDRVFAHDCFMLRNLFCPRAKQYYVADWRPRCMRRT